MTLSFEDLKFNKQILTAIQEAGYEQPTEVQKKTIPLITAGHDVMGIAQTGTGKTAAYVLPLLMKVKYAQGKNPRALILAPTRELAMQIGESVKLFSTHLDLRHLVLYGGIGPKTQIEEIAKGIDIIIATPGRLLDIYLKGDLVLKEIKTLVLDEADKMMDMGFMPQIKKVLEVIPSKRQNLLFSATMADRVMKLSEEFLEFPVIVEVTPQATPKESITQYIIESPNLMSKIHLLEFFLKKEEFKKVMIFARTRHNAENVYKFIHRKVNQSVRVLHANKGQNTRINAMEAFKSGEIEILVSTDVSSRGIDVNQITHVINFDIPFIYEDYVHRIGRTGRVLFEGEAISFVNPAEEYHITKIEKLIKMKIPRRPMPPEVLVEKTPFEEFQEQNREIDEQKKRDDPSFQGAFHEKKSASKSKPKDKKDNRERKKRR